MGVKLSGSYIPQPPAMPPRRSGAEVTTSESFPLCRSLHISPPTAAASLTLHAELPFCETVCEWFKYV